jgi:hypothetical protein
MIVRFLGYDSWNNFGFGDAANTGIINENLNSGPGVKRAHGGS